MNDEPERQPAAIDRRSASQSPVEVTLDEAYESTAFDISTGEGCGPGWIPSGQAAQSSQPPPALRSAHTNGRREDRLRNAMTRPRKTIATGKGTITGPITRAAPKRPAGMPARQWKRQRMMYVRGTKNDNNTI